MKGMKKGVKGVRGGGEAAPCGKVMSVQINESRKAQGGGLPPSSASSPQPPSLFSLLLSSAPFPPSFPPHPPAPASSSRSPVRSPMLGEPPHGEASSR